MWCHWKGEQILHMQNFGEAKMVRDHQSHMRRLLAPAMQSFATTAVIQDDRRTEQMPWNRDLQDLRRTRHAKSKEGNVTELSSYPYQVSTRSTYHVNMWDSEILCHLLGIHTPTQQTDLPKKNLNGTSWTTINCHKYHRSMDLWSFFGTPKKVAKSHGIFDSPRRYAAARWIPSAGSQVRTATLLSLGGCQHFQGASPGPLSCNDHSWEKFNDSFKTRITSKNILYHLIIFDHILLPHI